MRRLVLVADDLGVSPGVNKGIAQAARAGLVREASLCVTGAAVAAGVALARDLGIGVGLHLSLTLGRALRGPIAGLTDRNGAFGGLGRALLRTSLRAVDRTALRAEVRAQFDRLGELGVVPTHANGHHHVHCFPVVRDLFAAECAARGVRWTRLPAELPGLAGRGAPAPRVLRALAARARAVFAAQGLRTLPFAGATLENRRDHGARFLALLDHLPADGAVECMVHPRVPDAEAARLDPGGAARDAAAPAELATLTAAATADALRARGITAVGFAAIAGGREVPGT